MNRESIYNLSFAGLQTRLAELGGPAFRAEQIWNWLYVHRASDWSEMRNLPKHLRARLSEQYELSPFEVVQVEGAAGETRKLLLRSGDGELTETVLLPAGKRSTACISSQVGCKFGCLFCASGQNGFQRDLSVAEMVGQALEILKISEERLSHVVFMGTGEPLDNYDNLIRAARILNHEQGLNIGARRITISTVGLIPGIERLAEEKEQFELAVSLHATENELRSKLIPANRRYPLRDLMAACREYTLRTKRIITFEYTLIKNVNDSLDQARHLADFLSGFKCRVNLIPLSRVEEYKGEHALAQRGRKFIDILASKGINATLRYSKGSRVKAACGQLRSRHAPE